MKELYLLICKNSKAKHSHLTLIPALLLTKWMIMAKEEWMNRFCTCKATRPRTTWAYEMNFVINHATGAGWIARNVDQQSSVLPLYHRCHNRKKITPKPKMPCTRVDGILCFGSLINYCLNHYLTDGFSHDTLMFRIILLMHCSINHMNGC